MQVASPIAQKDTPGNPAHLDDRSPARLLKDGDLDDAGPKHDLAITLGINRATALRIVICRTPRQASWAADIHRIADRFALRDDDLDALMTTWTPPDGAQ